MLTATRSLELSQHKPVNENAKGNLNGRKNHEGLPPVGNIDKELRERNEGGAGKPAKQGDGDDAAPVIFLQFPRHHGEDRFIEHAVENTAPMAIHTA